MKLLFDANLSPKLARRLAELFPGSTHVSETGLARFTSDEAIWAFARDNGFALVTADADFLTLARAHGSPPQFIRLENCNYRTGRVEELLRTHAVRIAELANSTRAVLVIRNTA